MIGSVSALTGNAAKKSALPVNISAKDSFERQLSASRIRSDYLTKAPVSGVNSVLYDMYLRFCFPDTNKLSWINGRGYVSELAAKGIVSGSLNELGNAIVLMPPPEDVYDKYGNRLIDNGANWVELKLDDGFENTEDYVGMLKSSVEHQWQGYNAMVEKYGDIYPNEKAWLEEQEKLLGILQKMANS